MSSQSPLPNNEQQNNNHQQSSSRGGMVDRSKIEALAPSDEFKQSYVGVTHRKRRGKFQARIYKMNKEYNIGLFDLATDAAFAYDAAYRLFGLKLAQKKLSATTLNNDGNSDPFDSEEANFVFNWLTYPDEAMMEVESPERMNFTCPSNYRAKRSEELASRLLASTQEQNVEGLQEIGIISEADLVAKVRKEIISIAKLAAAICPVQKIFGKRACDLTFDELPEVEVRSRKRSRKPSREYLIKHQFVQQQQQQQQQIVHYNRGKPILTPPTGHRSESELIEFIMQALRRDGNVLLPVDASGRVLELLLVLDRHWDRQRLGAAYNLCWVGPMSINTIEFARAQLEWMNPPLGAQFDSQRGLNPYRLKNVKICSSVSELESVMEKSGGNPTAVLASGASLDHGPARDLLLKWGDNPDNLVLLTNSSRCVPRGDVWSQRLREKQGGIVVKEKKTTKEDVAASAGAAVGEADDEGKQLVGAALAPSDVSIYTAASQLLYKWCVAKASGEEMADEIGVDTYVPHRAPLAGAELKGFLAAEEEERRMKKAEAEKKAMMQEIELARGQLRLGEDTEGGGGGVDATTKGATGSATSTTAGAGVVSPKRPRKKSRFNQDLFIKFSKPVHMTFDVREEAVGLGQPDAVAKYGIGESMSRQGDVVEDDYGISVKAESFVDIVTGVDPSKFSGGTGRIGEEVTRRGLGFGVDGKQVVTPGGGDADNLLNDAEDEGMNEKMLEIVDLSSGKGIIRGRNGRQPIKVSVIPRRLEVLAEVVYVPLEGRVDARAARQQVRALQPRHLVVIGGSKSNSLLLGDALRSSGPSSANGNSNTVHVPVDGDTIQLTVGHAAYPVRLLDTPYLTKSEKEAMEVEEKEIEPVEPFEAKIGECTVSLVDFVATGKKWAVDGSLVLAPRRQESSLKQPSLMLSAREVLLTDLRSEVIALGMKAEYSALSGYSQLVVNGKIFVRKDTASGKLGVEGPLCEDFFRVRSLVSSQFVTL
mmetsp:Transcript_8134/g.13394  ORF Transcript_8134/g.13394 Transcript_8134/m.13394 type:complete len:990 (-) Transcript_8134:52-3021(-)